MSKRYRTARDKFKIGEVVKVSPLYHRSGLSGKETYGIVTGFCRLESSVRVRKLYNKSSEIWYMGYWSKFKENPKRIINKLTIPLLLTGKRLMNTLLKNSLKPVWCWKAGK